MNNKGDAIIPLIIMGFIILIMVIVGTSNKTEPQYVNVILLHKKEKLTSHYSFITKTQVIDTEYFFIYSDGTIERVDLTRYVTYKEGSKFNKIKGMTDYE